MNAAPSSTTSVEPEPICPKCGADQRQFSERAKPEVERPSRHREEVVVEEEVEVAPDEESEEEELIGPEGAVPEEDEEEEDEEPEV